MPFNKKNQPTPNQRKPRGKGKRTLWLEALLNNGYESEQDYWDELIGLSKKDLSLKKFLHDRMYPTDKSTLPACTIRFPKNSTPQEKSEIIFKAMSNGSLPADVGNELIAGIEATLKIKDIVELEDRVKQLEEALDKALEQSEPNNIN